MKSEALPRPAACPACVVPLPDVKAESDLDKANIILSIPTIHCAGCISAVERKLNATAGVRDARVNLSLKRVTIKTEPEITADDLVAVLTGIGYEAHELESALLAESHTDKQGRNLLMRLAVAGFAAMNVMLLSVAVWAGAEGTTRDLLHWFSALVALPAIAFSAQPFFKNALSALRVRRLNMDVPISLAITLAAGMSLFETMNGGHDAYFDAALSLTFFLLAGRYLDYRTRASARSAAQELAALEVPRALKIVDGAQKITPVGELAPGDTVLVKPGTRVPVDGVILSGESEIDRAFLTGESLPVYAGPDQKVSAGEINLTGPLTMRVTARSADSSLQRVAALVALAETSRNRYTSLADKAAAIYAPGVHFLAAAAFVIWYLVSGDLRLSINIAISVLIITCPCALGLAVPAVTTAASGRLYRKGVLLKNGTALERLAEVDYAVFDKTGTLTLGTPDLAQPDAVDDASLALAAALAMHSSHPLATALVEAAQKRGIATTNPALNDVTEVPGHGVSARLDGVEVRLGRAAWTGASKGQTTASYLKVGSNPIVEFTFNDALRQGVPDLIATFHKMGLATSMITGDSLTAAENTAKSAGIKTFAADMLPEDKISYINRLTAEGHKVLMVGDGLNDAGALSAAHVSISPASALDVARVASDIVILSSDFAVLGDCLVTARAARRRIKENFTLAAVYNMIAVPVALVGMATPLIAALAMSASSITVTLNSWRVR